MYEPLYHRAPKTLQHSTRVVGVRGHAVRLEESVMYPAGGGQPSDKGHILSGAGALDVLAVRHSEGATWHELSVPHGLELDLELAPGTEVQVEVDPILRLRASELHTGLHVLNALVYGRFDGALVTGAQIGDDGTARMDFALEGVEKAQILELEQELNDVMASGLEIKASYLEYDVAAATEGIFRSAGVHPPRTASGLVRVIRIGEVDVQACGGTHVLNTAESRPFRFVKVDNKGRHNRRVRIALVE